MPYQETVNSSILLGTTSAESANLGNTLFVTTNQYFSNRMTPFNSFQEVKDDLSIPNTSPAYASLRLAFSQPGATVPIYLGRREADSLILTPSPVIDNKNYGLVVTVIDDATSTPVETTIAVDSGSSATATTIATALQVDVDAVSNITAVDDTGSISVTADSGYTFNISSVERLLDTYTTTETAATLLTALQDEDNENWYYLECEDHTETFILAMALEVEATDSSNYPKQYHTSVQEAATLTALPDPAVDIMGKLGEFGYARTVCRWKDDADTLFPEIAATVYNGQFQPGTTTWKFMSNIEGVSAARDPVTGKKLTTAKQGYISDRNGNWHGEERGINFAHGGKTVGGEWIDVIQTKDYLNDRIETGLLTLLLNQPGGKVPPNAAGRQQVKNVIDGILIASVNAGILSGYIPTSIPEDTPFADQASRILRQVNWVGYLAGAVHFIVVDGVLTYKDETLS